MSDLNHLFEKATEAEARELELLRRAVDETCKAYEVDFTASKKRDWDAAKDGLQKCVGRLEAKYFAEEPSFPNLYAVVKFLQDEGYKIKKTKLYQDRDLGLIKVDPDGTVKQAEAMAYITRADLGKMPDRTDQLDEHSAKFKKKEMDKLEVQTEKLQFELDKEKGKYLPKTDVRTEFALKLGALESIFRNLIRTQAADYITAVGGKPKKAQVLVDLLYADLDDVLNQMCNLEEVGIELRLDSGEEP